MGIHIIDTHGLGVQSVVFSWSSHWHEDDMNLDMWPGPHARERCNAGDPAAPEDTMADVQAAGGPWSTTTPVAALCYF